MGAEGDDGPYEGAYQGAPGSFSELAARRWLGPGARLLPCRDLAGVFDALRSGHARYAIVPTVNSIAGRVPGAAELLERADVYVVAERRVPVVQALIGLPGASLATIEEVRSHPVALDQCRRFLAVHPRVRVAPWFDTAGAVRDVVALGRRDVAAIAGAAAAREYGGAILRFGIQDRPDNVTTFQLIGLQRRMWTRMRRITAADPVAIDELRRLVPGRFRDFVKGVVDLRRAVLLIDADMQADQEAALLAEGSLQADVWGINLYPQLDGPDWIEFDSMINLRPSFGNRSRGVDDAGTREAVRALVESLVRR